MLIRQNPDTERANAVRRQLLANDGYCPCKLERIPENKCLCLEFLNQESGMCSCGLYIKENNDA